jgi:hypothetical protein
MKSTEANRFKKLYQRHLRLLKLQGKSQKPLTPIPELSAGSGIILIAVLIN